MKKDLEIREAKAWAASNKLTAVWKFNLSGDMRIRFLRASVESSLLFLSKSWTLTTALEKQLDGCYTRLLRAALNVSWKDRISNKESQFQQVSRYVGCILVATVGEVRTGLFSNYFFGNQRTADALRWQREGEAPNNNIH